MAERRVVLLTLTVIGPDLLPPDHLDDRVAVCFCGRPSRRTSTATGQPLWWDRCEVCGWAPPWKRSRPEPLSDLERDLEESLRNAQAECG